jgi:Arc/MetJ-type ribon-helix-helix transcriptional regulator
MKMYVSLSDEEIQFLDQYAKSQGYPSRSAVVHAAIGILRSSKLGDVYVDASQEWEDSGESENWGPVASGGLQRVARIGDSA